MKLVLTTMRALVLFGLTRAARAIEAGDAAAAADSGDDAFAALLAAFEAECAPAGGRLWPHLSRRDGGLFTDEEIPARTTIMRLPKKCVLFASDAAAMGLDARIYERDPAAAMMLVVGMESYRERFDALGKPFAFFQAYNRTLPTDLSAFPTNWDAELVGSLPAAPQKEVGATRAFLRAWAREARSADPDVTEDAIKAAYLRTHSRVFASGGSSMLLPVGDLFNHGPPPYRNVFYDHSDRNLKFFEFVTTREIDAGEQLCISYGRRAQTDFLLDYAFTEAAPNNKRFGDVVKVSYGNKTYALGALPKRRLDEVRTVGLVTAMQRFTGAHRRLLEAALEVARRKPAQTELPTHRDAGVAKKMARDLELALASAGAGKKFPAPRATTRGVVERAWPTLSGCAAGMRDAARSERRGDWPTPEWNLANLYYGMHLVRNEWSALLATVPRRGQRLRRKVEIQITVDAEATLTWHDGDHRCAPECAAPQPLVQLFPLPPGDGRDYGRSFQAETGSTFAITVNTTRETHAIAWSRVIVGPDSFHITAADLTIYEPGSRVEARWRDDGGSEVRARWFPATVRGRRLRDNTYALEFDDGNEATEVGVRDVRPLPDFPEGAKVEWLQDDEDAWLPGVVAASEEIDDASDEGRPSWYGVDFDDGSGRKILASAVHLDVSETHAGDEIFNPGDVVQARWRHEDEWFAAKVEAVRSGDRYDVAFDDGWKEKNVHESYLRWPQIFKKGDVVDAFCFGREKLYRATVGGLAEISPDGAASYRLFYDDGEEDELEARYMSLVARPFEAG